ncbi:LytTR family DNA-binding domain-containing protein [Bacillus sp. FJAT-22090]|uniref:LytR/AlgR family response regulator transcription factor n=1 Tax=Bacillus sp. FJAT-22090 TaxID=1581038 RepID=UPI0011A5A7EF|nr:LytTR family DNA-binding domain-containing protein [Bacillus sp. FJAT-22090]
MTLKVVIIDDERFSREELSYLLSKHRDIEIIGEADSSEKGLTLVAKKEPDIVFVDIEMTGLNGIEFAKIASKLKKPPIIIFATAFPNYAIEAFSANATDYLLKPFDPRRIDETINRIKELSKPEHSRPTILKLAVHENERIIYIEPSSVLFVYRNERDTIIRTSKNEYTSRYTLKELEEKLSDYNFYRTHKSFLVNIEQIAEVSAWSPSIYQIKLNGVSEQIPLSRNYVKDLRELLEI